MVPALGSYGGDEHFERRMTGAGAHTGQAGVDPHRAALGGNYRVCDPKAKIVVRVHAALRFGLEHPVISLKPRAHPVHVKRTAAVRDIHTMRAIAFHQQRLLRRSEEHTSELQSLMRISYAGFCLKKKKQSTKKQQHYKT